MTFDGHHIHIIGRYRQGQHTLMTSRSQGQSQGHEDHFRFLAVLGHRSPVVCRVYVFDEWTSDRGWSI